MNAQTSALLLSGYSYSICFRPTCAGSWERNSLSCHPLEDDSTLDTYEDAPFFNISQVDVLPVHACTLHKS